MITGICIVLSVIILLFVSMVISPGAAEKTEVRKNLVSELAQQVYNAKAEALGEVSYIRKIYKIPLDQAVAPEPAESCFGEISDGDSEGLEKFRAEVLNSELMDGQDLIFKSGTDVKYYFDDSTAVICWKEVIDGKTCSFCEVKVQDATQLRRKVFKDNYSLDDVESTRVLAKEANAIAAMSGDYYKFRDYGICVFRNELKRFTESSFYPDTKSYNFIDTCFIKGNGDLAFFYKGEETDRKSMEQFVSDENVMFSLAFGPVLIEDYKFNENMNRYPIGEPGKNASRAAFGQYDTLHYLYLNVSNGTAGKGDTFEQLARHMMDKGVRHAYNLDGGQTAEIVFRDKIYNDIDYASERRIGDCIYIATATGGMIK